MFLINSEKGNKSSKKITLRALVTERLSRAKSSLELFYSSPFKLIMKTQTRHSPTDRSVEWAGGRPHQGENEKGNNMRCN